MLRLLKKYIVDSQLFVSAMGTMLALYFWLQYDTVRVSTDLVAILFVTYLNGYLYTKYQNSKYYKKVIALNIFLGLISLYLLWYNEHIFFYKWCIIVGIGLLYNSFFLFKIIRRLPLVKVFYVGFTWALLNAWLVFSEMDWTIFGVSWLYITALVLPFDIRDRHEDEVVTFPKIIGVQNTKYLAYLLLFLALIVGIYHIKLYFSLSLFLSVLVSYIMIYFAEDERRDAYYSFGIELCVGLPFLFSILLN